MKNPKSRIKIEQIYNMHNKFVKLYNRSLNEEYFSNLMYLISDQNNIRLAIKNIKKNKGSNTPGPNGHNINNILNMNTKKCMNMFKKRFNYYIPGKIKLIEIPKENNKVRILGIPDIEDRVIQQCILQILNPILEAKFKENNYGFRQNRNCKDAIFKMIEIIKETDYKYIINIDIKSFFDNINHTKLSQQIWNIGIRDKKLLKILNLIIKSDGIKNQRIIKRNKGLPQGGIISPLLANLVLNELDNYIETNIPNCKIIRYADDFEILCTDLYIAKEIKRKVISWLKEELKLNINESKTKIINLYYKYSEFLGFKIKINNNTKEPKILIANNKIIKIKEKIDNIEDQTNKLLIINGINEYYNISNNTNKELKKIFNTNINNSYNIKYLNKKEMINNYTMKEDYYYKDLEDIIIYYEKNRSIKFNELIIIKYLIQKGKCYITQNPLNIYNITFLYLNSNINNKDSINNIILIDKRILTFILNKNYSFKNLNEKKTKKIQEIRNNLNLNI